MAETLNVLGQVTFKCFCVSSGCWNASSDSFQLIFCCTWCWYEGRPSSALKSSICICLPCQLLYKCARNLSAVILSAALRFILIFFQCLDSRRWAEASVLPSHPVSRAQSRGGICRSALSGSRGALRRLLPETQALLLTGTQRLPLNHQLSQGIPA